MTEPTLESFVDFVNQQAAINPDRVIEHTSWGSCAVGDYVTEVLDQDPQDIDMTGLALELFEEDDLYDFFNDAGMRYGINSTYGELARSIPLQIPVKS